MLYFFLLLPALAAAAPIVGAISIEGQTRTRPEIVRRELLFAPGEPLDSTRVAETERNLRGLLFLGKVDIAIEERGDTADVRVRVEDLYSRALSPLLGGEPGEFSYGIVALDYNFLGRGQSLEATLEQRAIEGWRADLAYSNPRLYGSRQALGVDLGLGAEDHLFALSLARPFATLADPWAYGASLSSREYAQRLYDSGTLAGRYRDRLDGAALWLTRSYGQQVKVRPGLRLSLSERRFRAAGDFAYAPRDRRRFLPSLSLTLWRPAYARARFVYDLGRVEDLQMGSFLVVGASLSSRALGSDRSFLSWQIQLSPRWRPCAQGYVFATLFASLRTKNGAYSDLYALAALSAFVQRGPHTLALRLRADALHRPEDRAQLLLGLDSGLRGYAPRRFDGSRRLLAAAEFRPLLRRRALYVLAGALFVETGSAWTPGRDRAEGIGTAGAGVRVGLPRIYNTPVLRADLAYGFTGAAWQLSFGLGQYF